MRVFNKRFIDENVFTKHGLINPIFFFGKENIENQKKIENLEKNLEKSEEETNKLKFAKENNNKKLDDLTKTQAKYIKEILRSSDKNNSYNNYDKASFKSKAQDFLELSNTYQKILSKLDFDNQKLKIKSFQQKKVELLYFKCPDTQNLSNQVIALCKEKVISSTIKSLKDNHQLSGWVKTGLAQHKEQKVSDCLFCEQPLPDHHIQKLEAHFNDRYNDFIAQIEKHYDTINSEITNLKHLQLPHESELYDHLRDDFKSAKKNHSYQISAIKTHLTSLLDILEEKKQKPFESINANPSVFNVRVDTTSNVNEILKKHNQQTEDFQTEKNKAREEIEEYLVAEILTEYKSLNNAIPSPIMQLFAPYESCPVLKVAQ